MTIAPPRPRGPPLNALRAFEAAARRGSFSAAADELCVTPGAIAQHVKSLEAWAGTAVDTRGPVFSLYSLAVEEARNGAGVLIGHEALVRADLDSGTLVAPFRTKVTLDRRLVIGMARPADPGSHLEGIVKALTA